MNISEQTEGYCRSILNKYALTEEQEKQIQILLTKSEEVIRPITIPQTVNFSIDAIIESNAITHLFNLVGEYGYYIEIGLRLHKKCKDKVDAVINIIKIGEKCKSQAEAEALLMLSQYSEVYDTYTALKSALDTLQHRYETIETQYEMVSRLITAYDKKGGVNPDKYA